MHAYKMMHSIRKNTQQEILRDILQGIVLQCHGSLEGQVELCYILTRDFSLGGRPLY